MYPIAIRSAQALGELGASGHLVCPFSYYFFFNLIRHLKFLQDPEKCPHLKLIRSKEGAAPGAELASQYVKLRQEGAIIPSGLGLGWPSSRGQAVIMLALGLPALLMVEAKLFYTGKIFDSPASKLITLYKLYHGLARPGN